MKKKISVVLVAFLLGFLSLVPVKAKDTEINKMTIDVDIDSSGHAYVREVWNMNVYEGTEVYKVLDHMDESVVSRLKVQDDTGLIYQTVDDWDVDWDFDEKIGKCGILQDGDHYELCFGIGEYGERTYTFEYQISNFVKQYDDKQGFNYAFFSEMSLDIDRLFITVSSPYDFDENNSQIWAFGYSGKVYYQDGHIVLENDDAIGEDGKVQLLMRIDSPIFQNVFENKGSFQEVLDDALDKSEYDEDLYQQDGYYLAFAYKSYAGLIAMIICGCIGLVIILILIYVSYYRATQKIAHYRFDDNQKYQDNEEIYRGIPCHGNLFEIYYLAKKAEIIFDLQKEGLISAILLQWIQNKILIFEKKEEKILLFFQEDGFEVDLRNVQSLEHPLEKKLLSFFVEAAGDNQILETHEFQEWCGMHHHELEEWFASIDDYVEKEYRYQGLLYSEQSEGHWLGKTIMKERDVFSASLREDMHKIAGLKRYLEDYQEDENTSLQQREIYMIYASLLDVHDKYEKQVQEIYPYEWTTSHLFYSSHIVHTMSHDSIHTSDSSVSGGGSSFSGGGGGGVR